MAQQIYKAPNIREQVIEEVTEFIEKKRVSRMILATKYQQTVLDKALKIKEKDVIKFEKQRTQINVAMEKVEEQINKLQTRLDKLIDTHNGLVNVEVVIEEHKD